MLPIMNRSMINDNELHVAAVELKGLVECAEKAFWKAKDAHSPDEAFQVLQDDLFPLVAPHRELVQKIKVLAADSPVVELRGDEHANIRQFIQQILLDKHETSQSLSGLHSFLPSQPPDREFEELQEVMEPINPLIWAGRFIEAGALVTGAKSLPKELKPFLQEVRQCFAAECYLAVVALSRTNLEIAVRKAYEDNELDDPNSHTSIQIERQSDYYSRNRYVDDFNPTLARMINRLCRLQKYRALKDEMTKIRDLGNSIIHGNRTVSRERAEDIAKRTLSFLHCLFES